MVAVLWAGLIFNIWNLNHSYLCSISQICHAVNMHFCFIRKSHPVNSFGRKQVTTQDQYKIAVMNQHYKISSFHKWATLLTCIIVLPNPTASVMSWLKKKPLKTNRKIDKTKQYKSMCQKHVSFSYTLYRSTGLLNSSKNTKRNLKESHNSTQSFFDDHWRVFTT